MPQVRVRDSRLDDQDWIQSVYRDYLADLAPSATGLFPMLPEIGQRESEQIARLFSGRGAHVLTVCFAEERVGFAKITALSATPSTTPPTTEFSMAEFFIARAWRRRGIGAQAVRLILDRFEGSWLITEHLRNEAAVRFWRRVVGAYTGTRYQERIVNGEVQQRFMSGRRHGRSV
jgi:predicted acetyltransferase